MKVLFRRSQDLHAAPPTRPRSTLRAPQKTNKPQRNDASQQTTPQPKNARTAHKTHNTTLKDPSKSEKRRPATDCSKLHRKQSVWLRQSTHKQAAPPSRGSPQHPKRWPTARSWRPRARPIKARRPSKQHKTAVPPTPSRLKWFGSQITEDNLNVDYVSNSLREEDRKPENAQRPRPQPLSKLTSWLGWSRSTINDDESSQSSPKRSASPFFFKSFRRSQSPTHDDTQDKSSNTHGSNQDLELLAAQEAALEKAGGAAVEQGHKLQHYCRGPRPDACRSDRGKLDWYDFLADTELCTMHFDALEGTDAMKLNIVLADCWRTARCPRR